MRFALVLYDSLEQQRAAVRSFKEDFHFLLHMEERARDDDGLLEVGIDRVVTKSTVKPSSL